MALSGRWTVNNVAQALPASTPAPVSASHLEAREGPAPAQWQAVKEEIRVLYEKKPLKDVRRILEQRHGFRATYVLCKLPNLNSVFIFPPPASHMSASLSSIPMLILGPD